MATRPRARACIFHKTLGLMLHVYLLRMIYQAGMPEEHHSDTEWCLECRLKQEETIVLAENVSLIPNTAPCIAPVNTVN